MTEVRDQHPTSLSFVNVSDERTDPEAGDGSEMSGILDKGLSRALDDSLRQLRDGQATLDECLARYPEYAAELGALLEISIEISEPPRPTVDPAAFAAGRARMLAAVAERQRRQDQDRTWWRSLLPGRMGVAGSSRMWPALRAAVSAVVLLALAGTGAALILFSPGRVVYQVAAVDVVNGVVEAMPAGGDSWHPVSAGEVLETGGSLRTGSLSAARLTLSDGSTIGLDAETELIVSEMSARRDGGGRLVVISQPTGHTHVSVPPLSDQTSGFEIRTPTAVVTVRGTEFSVDVDANGTTDVMVVEGVVDVMAREVSVSVRAGQGVTVLPDHPPTAVRTLLVEDGTTESTEAVSPPDLISPEPTDDLQELPPVTESPTPSGTTPVSPTPTAPSTPTAGTTDTPYPTNTPQPTNTPMPPHTPAPTHTPEPPPTDVVVITRANYQSVKNELDLCATSDGGFDPGVTLTASPGGVMTRQGETYHIRFTLPGECPCTVTVTSSRGGWATVTVGP